MLNDAEDLRTMAEYAEEFVITEEYAEATLQDAAEFVEQASALPRDS